MSLITLAYVSSATTLFTPEELGELLTRSRTKNAAAGITGMLLYKDGNFLQVLEGEEESVIELKTRIARDPRHHGMIVMLQQAVGAREFGDWSMAFVDLDHGDRRAELRRLPGHSEFMATELSATGIGGSLAPLLESFRHAIR